MTGPAISAKRADGSAGRTAKKAGTSKALAAQKTGARNAPSETKAAPYQAPVEAYTTFRESGIEEQLSETRAATRLLSGSADEMLRRLG